MNVIKAISLLTRYMVMDATILDRDRFEQQLFQATNVERSSKPSSSSSSGLDKIISLIWNNPRDFFHKILRYKLLGYDFLIFIGIETVLISYSFVKITLNLIYVGNDRNKLDLCDWYLVPSLARTTHDPNLFNKILFSSITIGLFVWFRDMYSLMKNSIDNDKVYLGPSTSRLNLAYFASFQNGPLSKPTTLFKLFINYIDYSKHNKERYDRAHIVLSDFQINENVLILEEVEFKVLMISHNFIDFDKVYQDFDNFRIENGQIEQNRPELFMINSRSMNSRTADGQVTRLYVSNPLHRTNFSEVLFGVILMQSNFCFGTMATIGIPILGVYLELLDGDPQLEKDIWNEHFNKIYELHRWLRVAELFWVEVCLFTLLYHFLQFTWNSLILSSRINKVAYIVAYDTIRLRQSYAYNQFSVEILDHPNYGKQRFSEKQVNRLISLIKVVKYEFRDYHEQYTNFLNIIIIGCSFTLPNSFALILHNDNLLEKTVITLFAGVSIFQIFAMLFLAGLVERAVSIETFRYQSTIY